MELVLLFNTDDRELFTKWATKIRPDETLQHLGSDSRIVLYLDVGLARRINHTVVSC